MVVIHQIKQVHDAVICMIKVNFSLFSKLVVWVQVMSKIHGYGWVGISMAKVKNTDCNGYASLVAEIEKKS